MQGLKYSSNIPFGILLNFYVKSQNYQKAFLLYNKPCDCDANGISYKRKTDILIDIYDDDETHTCACNTKS